MSRLPIPGADSGTWGSVLNDYLSQSHKADGTLKDNSVGNAQIQDNTITSTAIADGTITEENLTQDVKVKLNSGGVSSVAALSGTITSTTLVNALSLDLKAHYAPVAGRNLTASAYSWAEGDGTTASGSASHAEGYSTTAFRVAKSARGMVPAVQQSFIPNTTTGAGQTAVSLAPSTGIITIPINGGITSGKITILTENGTLRWDVIFSASNAATSYATRETGTVTVLASTGAGAPIYGSSPVTWTVSGNTTGQVVISPSTVPPACRVWCELLQLGSTAQIQPPRS